MKKNTDVILLSIIVIVLSVGLGMLWLAKSKPKSKSIASNNYLVEIEYFRKAFSSFYPIISITGEPWAGKFRNTLINNNILFTDIENVGETKDGKYLIVLMSGGHCEEIKAYRYNIQYDTMELTTIDDKGRGGCLGNIGLRFTSPYANNVSEIMGDVPVEGCLTAEMYFSYDEKVNKITIKKESYSCEGKMGNWEKTY